MNHVHLFQLQRLLALPLLTLFFLTLSLMASPHHFAIADDTRRCNESADIDKVYRSDEEVAGVQAFFDFFGPDGVDDCLQSEFDQDHDTPNSDIPSLFSSNQAILTTSWHTVGGGRINRKYLNGLIAFCYDEELAFPHGATYEYSTASDASIYGQAAAIAQRFGQSGVDNAQWWSECQVAIWAVRAGCQSFDSAAAFARSYCADRKITDPTTVEDYAYIVGTLVTETAGASDLAYLYQASDPANQRILSYLFVWPDPAPIYPSPQYDQVSAEGSHTASRQHGISVDRKLSAITGEPLAGAVFEVYENQRLVGTIITNSQGTGSCQWTYFSTANTSATKEYCSNFDKLDPETRKTITVYTNRDDAYSAAKQEAMAAARLQAEAMADTPSVVTIQETTVPTGFFSTQDSSQTVSLTGNETTTLSALNTPWSSTLLIHKVDGVTGETILADTTFALYEWNGTDYEISPHYQIIRQDDGIYTVTPSYEDGQPGQLYFTQSNQGRFALAELEAPTGYYRDPELSYFTLRPDEPILYGHNASPDHYDIQNDTKFANRPKPQPHYESVSMDATASVTRTHQLILDRKTSSITERPLSGAAFQIYEDGVLVGSITSDAQGKGSCQWEITETAQATATREYCSNYGQLEPEEKSLVNGFTSKEDAMASAQAEATLLAQSLAEQLADRPRSVTVKEIVVPDGFSPSHDEFSPILMSGEAHATFSAVNSPWSATLQIHKTDGNTGEPIPADASFALYEWNGTDYEISPHYQIIRREDGVYTVSSDYAQGQSGLLYYTQTNQGRFALAETTAPAGYLPDSEWFFFEITSDGQTILGHNANPDHYPMGSNSTFANEAIPPAPIPETPSLSSQDPGHRSSAGASTGDRSHLWLTVGCLIGSVSILFCRFWIFMKK